MQSQIDPSLEEETSGQHIGKILVAKLRAVLGVARDESSAHGTAIENLAEVTSTALGEKINFNAVPGVVRGTALTGLTFAVTTAIEAADTVLAAMGKLQAQITKLLDQVNIFTKAQRSRGMVLVPAANVYTPDFSAALFFRFIPAGNFTLANPTNMPEVGDHQSGSFFITQDATGGRTITFGNLYQAAGGLSTIVLSTTPNAKDRIDYIVTPSGNIDISIAKDRKA